jgi:hypothetical protein
MQILTDAERLAIRAVAGGDRSQLDAASRAFDRAVPLHGVASCIELQFMAEVLAPVPDLVLRSQYRKALLQESVRA